MKRFYTLILCVILLLSMSRSQDLQPKGIMQVSLSADFSAYFQALEEQNFDLALDFVFPALFDLIPRDFMEESLENEATDGENEIRIKHAKILPVSEIIEDEKNYYALVSYSYVMEIQEGESGSGSFDALEEEDGEEWESDGLDVDDFRRKYGVRNVQYDPAKKIIKVKREGKLIAIQSKDEFEDDGWKFIELKEDMKPMVDQLIPSGILTRLKS